MLGSVKFTETANATFSCNFNKPLQIAQGGDAEAGWTLTKNGTEAITVTGASVSGNTLTIETNATIAANDFVKITYSNGNLTDTYGNPFTMATNSALFLGGTDVNTVDLEEQAGYWNSSSKWSLWGGGGNDDLTGGYLGESLIGSSGADRINGIGGPDNIFLSEGTRAADTVVLNPEGWATGVSIIYNFDVSNSGGTNNDILDLPSNTIAADAAMVDGIDSGTIVKHSISNGLVTFYDGSGAPIVIPTGTAIASQALNYLMLNITEAGTTVAFSVDADGNGINDSLVVFQDGGPGWADALVRLFGVNGAILGTSAGQNIVQLVDTRGPEINSLEFSGTSVSFGYSEKISYMSGATHNPLYLNGVTQLTATNPLVTGNTLTVTVDQSIADTDWILMTLSADVQDASGNIVVVAGQKIAVGGDGTTVINMSGSTDSLGIYSAGGNDTITASNYGCSLDAGAGADTMIGGAGADEFHLSQGDQTATVWVDTNGSGALNAGDTFTFAGGVDVISGFAGGDNIDFGTGYSTSVTLSMMNAPTDGQAANQKYFLQQGSYSGGGFTVGTGNDTLVVYDGDKTGGVSQGAVILLGVATADLLCSGDHINWVG